MRIDKKIYVYEFIKKNPSLTSKQIHERLDIEIGYATLKRILAHLLNDRLIEKNGASRSTKYLQSKSSILFEPVDVDKYYSVDQDQRQILNKFNFELIDPILTGTSIFNDEELAKLEAIDKLFKNNTKELSKNYYRDEMERLAIDLSWKSSQIEGNTYSLLETEMLLKEKVTAQGKTKDEAVMLLNHKETIDFILENNDYLYPLTIRKIEDIHSMLTKDLNVDRGFRTRKVGISGTNYIPIEYEQQIIESMVDLCRLVNGKDKAFEKAFLTLMLLSYIQPFADGNKRTARIVSNSILIANNHCPLSFRSVDSIEYKKAMLIFYETNNLHPFKQIFIDQYEFAVNTYF